MTLTDPNNNWLENSKMAATTHMKIAKWQQNCSESCPLNPSTNTNHKHRQVCTNIRTSTQTHDQSQPTTPPFTQFSNTGHVNPEHESRSNKIKQTDMEHTMQRHPNNHDASTDEMAWAHGIQRHIACSRVTQELKASSEATLGPTHTQTAATSAQKHLRSPR